MLELRTSDDVVSRTHDFVLVDDYAVDLELCSGLIAAFEASGRRGPGSTGHGVDVEKKRSIDITLDRFPEWAMWHAQILQQLRPQVEKYFTDHHFALIGSLAPTIRNPKTGSIETLDARNWPELGKTFAAPLVWRLYRFGTMNLQKYEQGRGGYPHWHSEIFPEAAKAEALHRVLFVMAYLNDVTEGGETDFHYQRLSVAPRAGRIVIAPAGFTHTHRGRVPLSSDKYIATSWILFKPAEAIFGPARKANSTIE